MGGKSSKPSDQNDIGNRPVKEIDYFEFQVFRSGLELDVTIGILYWRVLLSNKFWANISTPLNLALTFMTALIAAKASTSSDFISEGVSMQLSFASLIITTINSFFQPQKKEQKLNELLTRIIKIGYDFEFTYWGNDPDNVKVGKFKEIQSKLLEFECDIYTKESNMFTELIWKIVQKTLEAGGRRVCWLDGKDLLTYRKNGIKMKKFVQETVNKNTEQERLGLSGLALREASQELEVQIHE
jgi:hypothetical protein